MTGHRRGYYYEVDFTDPENPRIRLAQRSRRLAQYFRYIRMGAVRIGATTNVPSKNLVAFRNPDGTHVVIVNAARGCELTIQGLPPASYGIRYTTESKTGRELPSRRIESGEPLSAEIREPGVITFYGLTSETYAFRP